MKLGVLGYTSRRSGLGAFLWDVRQNLPVDSWLSICGAKGQDPWLERQIDCTKPTPEVMAEYLDRYQPDMLLMVETPFANCVWDICRSRHVRTALVVMQEFYVTGDRQPDMFICPTRIAYGRVREINKAYFDWPVDVAPFTFRERTQARRFLHVVGFDIDGIRRQTDTVIAGFRAVKREDITLTIHAQRPWRGLTRIVEDDRIVVRVQDYETPQEIYEDSDVLLQPDAWAGYNRPLLEAKACGLPVITTDAAPMNELVVNPQALIPGKGMAHRIAGPYHTLRTVVTPDGVEAAIRRALKWNMPVKSTRARACAESHSWTPDRKADFWRLLEAICNR